MQLTQEQYNLLINWIRGNFIRSQKYNHQISSGTLRAAFEQSPTGFYIDRETFHHAMLDCDYIPYSYEADYWEFKISMKSPAITQYLGTD